MTTAIANAQAWAIGHRQVTTGKFHVRRVVWGRALAREEKRDGETIRKVYIVPAEVLRRSR